MVIVRKDVNQPIVASINMIDSYKPPDSSGGKLTVFVLASPIDPYGVIWSWSGIP